MLKTRRLPGSRHTWSFFVMVMSFWAVQGRLDLTPRRVTSGLVLSVTHSGDQPLILPSQQPDIPDEP